MNFKLVGRLKAYSQNIHICFGYDTLFKLEERNEIVKEEKVWALRKLQVTIGVFETFNQILATRI